MAEIDKLNTSFENLLINSDVKKPVNDDDVDPIQVVVAPDDYSSDVILATKKSTYTAKMKKKSGQKTSAPTITMPFLRNTDLK